jgi:AcrR family transcriptional regulator
VRDEEIELLFPLPSGRHGLPREAVVRSQRMRLLRGALHVAAREGYGGMTVTAVIAQASVSRKTFYELFADREDCFLAAYEHVTERALAGLHAEFALDAPWSARVRAGLAWALDALARHPEETRVAFVEVLAAGARALERRDRFTEQLALLLADGFEAASRAVAVPASTPTAVIGALSELIVGHVRREDVAQLRDALPDTLYCVLAPFLGPAAASEAAGAGAGAGRPRERVHDPRLLAATIQE